jgi:phenylalanyl-tRNA synthetase alpha subunit
MTDFKKIIYSLHPLERKVLPLISLGEISKICEKLGLSDAEVTTGVHLLDQKGFVSISKFDIKKIVLDKFGVTFLNSDLPEIAFLKELLSGEKKMSELKLDKSLVGSALGILKKNNLVSIRKEDEQIFSANSGAAEFVSSFVNPLTAFAGSGVLVSDLVPGYELSESYNELKRRSGFLKEVSDKGFNFTLSDFGQKLCLEIEKNYSSVELSENVETSMLKAGSFENLEFRHYDVSVSAEFDNIGRHHPMHEANSILSDVFVEMGFIEMEGPMVESAFWCMDTMWIPQDHPARDEQDTFYLEGSAKVPTDLAERVRDMHEDGIKRSHTPKGEWSKDITSKRLLRTHSTATTFRTLAKLGEKLEDGEDINGKYFYVAHNFRNEAIDATHLAEFFQGEGFIVGDNLSLAHLMGFIREYYLKLGINKIRFKPTFNPYTEPSMEAHYYDEKMNKWYALINSGIFRQETLEPLGLGGKTVLAWGMGASRVATLLAGKASMRDITGTTCDFDWLKNRPMMTRKIVKRTAGSEENK